MKSLRRPARTRRPARSLQAAQRDLSEADRMLMQVQQRLAAMKERLDRLDRARQPTASVQTPHALPTSEHASNESAADAKKHPANRNRSLPPAVLAEIEMMQSLANRARTSIEWAHEFLERSVGSPSVLGQGAEAASARVRTGGNAHIGARKAAETAWSAMQTLHADKDDVFEFRDSAEEQAQHRAAQRHLSAHEPEMHSVVP